jgi:RES domain-containing protein
LKFYRICKAKYAAQALNGNGAKQISGRSNSIGQPAVYVSQNLASAQLEMLVHITKQDLQKSYVFFALDIPNKFLEQLELTHYPTNWQIDPPPIETQQIGDNFMKGKSAMGLLVKSTLTPTEYNCILNVNYPAYNHLITDNCEGPFPLIFDQRLK